MALSDNDHIEALRARLHNKLREIDNERAELIEMMRVLGDAPKLLSRAPLLHGTGDTPKPVVKAASGGRTLTNRNVTELVRGFIDSYDAEKPLAVPEIVKFLFDHGVKGKQRSINAAVHVILKKEVGNRLRRVEGVGYFKPNQASAGV